MSSLMYLIIILKWLDTIVAIVVIENGDGNENDLWKIHQVYEN